MRKMPNDVEKLDRISQSVDADGEGNLTVGKNLDIDGKLTLNSLVSESNPDGDITKELGGSSRHAYMVIINAKFQYEIYTTKDYGWKIGELNSLTDFLTNDDYNELRVPGNVPASGFYYDESSKKQLVLNHILIPTSKGFWMLHGVNLATNAYEGIYMASSAHEVVKLF